MSDLIFWLGFVIFAGGIIALSYWIYMASVVIERLELEKKMLINTLAQLGVKASFDD